MKIVPENILGVILFLFQ